jgi:PAS domain S-box-containing protein
VITEFNRRAEELWGRKPNMNGGREKFCGSHRIYYPDGRFMPHKKCPMARVLRGEKLHQSELEIIVEREDGERRHVIPVPKILTNNKGEVIGAINCLYDITEYKRGEQALAEAARCQEILYRFVQKRSAATSLLDVLSTALDTITELLRCDRAAVLLFDRKNVMRCVARRGLSSRYCQAEEGHSPWKPEARKPKPICIPDVNVADLPKKLKGAIRAEGIKALAFIPLVAENRLVGKCMIYYNRTHVFSDEKISLALNAAGQLALGIERKRAEAALYESEERLRAIVEQATVGMARADREGRLLFVNQALCQMLGYNETELIGRPIQMFTHKEEAAKTAMLIRRLMRHGEPYELEKRYVRKDGSMNWVNVSASPVRDMQGKVQSVVAVVVDITARKKAETELRRSKEMLETLVQRRTQALQAANAELKSEIERRKGLEDEILAVSDREQQRLGQELHDSLCQDLTAIGLMARSTALRLKNHRVVQIEDLEQIAQLISNSVIDARNIARDLHKEEMDAANFVSALHDLAERKIWSMPCQLKIATQFEIESDTVASELYRILREALMNVNKHARATQTLIEVRRNKNELIFSVMDNGIGLGAKAKRGSGLGFHIMNYRAKSIGGRLEVEPQKTGHGTRVSVYLPNGTNMTRKTHISHSGST